MIYGGGTGLLICGVGFGGEGAGVGVTLILG